MVKNIKPGDYVYSVRYHCGSTFVFKGRVQSIDQTDDEHSVTVLWLYPTIMNPSRVSVETLYRSAHRAILAYLREEKKQLEGLAKIIEESDVRRTRRNPA